MCHIKNTKGGKFATFSFLHSSIANTPSAMAFSNIYLTPSSDLIRNVGRSVVRSVGLTNFACIALFFFPVPHNWCCDVRWQWCRCIIRELVGYPGEGGKGACGNNLLQIISLLWAQLDVLEINSSFSIFVGIFSFKTKINRCKSQTIYGSTNIFLWYSIKPRGRSEINGPREEKKRVVYSRREGPRVTAKMEGRRAWEIIWEGSGTAE